MPQTTDGSFTTKKQVVMPRVLKGFRDFMPETQELRQRCIATLQKTFSDFGFLPIDTPILEYEEILLSSSKKTDETDETEKQVYKFSDRGKRNVALRFDLTVPFARFMAEHHHSLTLPFNRYQIGKVFRGENTQRGRYREFLQCDFDIIGVDSATADSTILCVINSLFSSLYNILKAPILKNCAVHISHRGVLNELLKKENCDTQRDSIFRILDKSRKVPSSTIRDSLLKYVPKKSVDLIMSFCQKENTNKETLEKIQSFVNPKSEGVAQLKEIISATEEQCSFVNIVVDPSIMRGLDYYTGFVCETFVKSQEDIGSLCSGGRYNNLTKRFSTAELHGVGASVGLDRLLSLVQEKNIKKEHTRSSHHTIIYCYEKEFLSKAFLYQKLLQDKNISVEIFPVEKGLKHVFKYAEKTSSNYLLLLGEEEISKNQITIKNLNTREQTCSTIEGVSKWILNKKNE